MAPRSLDPPEAVRRVERCLTRCLELSQDGRFRQVLREVERALPAAAQEPALEAQLQVWKAQALLSMGLLDRAVTAAERSWTLDPSPQACHVLASALHRAGDAEEAEELLREGIERYPEADHLGLQLAVSLADQKRVPEALDLIEELPLDGLADDLQVFAHGLRANLLAACGRWGEAETVLRRALRRHPEAPPLVQVREDLARSSRRLDAERALAASWDAGLTSGLATAAEAVDLEIARLAATLELNRLQMLSARRLWQALWRADEPRPTRHAEWAAGAIAAVLELDDEAIPATLLARACGVRTDGVRRALRRFRAYLDGLDPQFSARAFATTTNPRLQETTAGADADNVVPFPVRGGDR